MTCEAGLQSFVKIPCILPPQVLHRVLGERNGNNCSIFTGRNVQKSEPSEAISPMWTFPAQHTAWEQGGEGSALKPQSCSNVAAANHSCCILVLENDNNTIRLETWPQQSFITYTVTRANMGYMARVSESPYLQCLFSLQSTPTWLSRQLK